MSVERNRPFFLPEQEPYLINIASLFRRKFGISHVLFDLDDTLNESCQHFQSAIDKFGEAMAPLLPPGMSQHTFQDTWLSLWQSYKSRFNVDPALTFLIANSVWKQFGHPNLHPQFCMAKAQLEQDIYYTPTPFQPGAIDTLRLLNLAGYQNVIVTHARPEWTRLKTKALGPYVAKDHILCTPVNQPKAPYWATVFARLDLSPSTTIVVGNDYQADIEPNLDAFLTFWVNSHDLLGRLPANVVPIPQAASLIPTMSDLLYSR